MEKNNLKNIVVLKNLPSNIVDEAIVILKSNKKIKKLEIFDKKSNSKDLNPEIKNNIHVINEAEMLVNNYISTIEKDETKEKYNYKMKEKYNRLKKYTILSGIMLIMSLVLHFI
ncbi:MAG: hypothetical protein IKF17_01015 [Clostridia bacterium]|nr:hypothetical protein [Clostridia bacterium]